MAGRRRGRSRRSEGLRRQRPAVVPHLANANASAPPSGFGGHLPTRGEELQATRSPRRGRPAAARGQALAAYSTRALSLARARDNRDLTVPSGMPRAAAVSSPFSSRKYRLAMTSRSSSL